MSACLDLNPDSTLNDSIYVYLFFYPLVKQQLQKCPLSSFLCKTAPPICIFLNSEAKVNLSVYYFQSLFSLKVMFSFCPLQDILHSEGYGNGILFHNQRFWHKMVFLISTTKQNGDLGLWLFKFSVHSLFLPTFLLHKQKSYLQLRNISFAIYFLQNKINLIHLIWGY